MKERQTEEKKKKMMDATRLSVWLSPISWVWVLLNFWNTFSPLKKTNARRMSRIIHEGKFWRCSREMLTLPAIVISYATS